MATTPIDEGITKALAHLEQEISSIRTGRANPALVENLVIECYGSHSPLQQVAAISTPEPQLLVIQPWDQQILKDIEKAITQSALGINPVVDGVRIRLPFPPMTTERRMELKKVVKEKGEEAKVRVRTLREETVKKIKQAERDGKISEDEQTLQLKDVQQAVDRAGHDIDGRIKLKEQELDTI